MADYAIHDTTLEAIADTIRKKEGSSALIDPAEYAERVNLMGMLEEKTASGAIAHIEDGADGVPLKNWLVTLPASLDGYTEVNGVQISSDNLLGFGSLDFTLKGIRYYTVDGVLYLDGTTIGETSSADSTFKDNLTFYLPAGTYYLNRGSLAIPTYIYDYDDFVSGHALRINNGTFTLAEGKKLVLGFYIYNKSFTDSKVDACVNVGSTAITYEDTTVPTQYTASLGRTIYGGTADIVTGEGEDENGNAFTFTPITPTPETALGVNNFWADEGDSDVTYRSSGTVTPVPVVPTLISKTITENDTYYAEDDNADGYSEVTVNVQGGATPFVPQFTETKIADNTAHASSFTLTEDYANYDMVKIVWYESATVSGFLYTTPDILDEIFAVGVGKLCINKPSTNYYACYTKSGLTWTRSNQRVIDVHEIYGVTFTNCTMTATDLYKRGASTTTKYAVTSQTSLKDYDLFMMASIHATDGSETMPATWLYQYPPENMSGAFSCPVPTVLQEYNANDEAFVISEYGMTSARYFMVQGIKFTPTPSLLSMSPAPTPSEPDSEDPEEEVEEEET